MRLNLKLNPRKIGLSLALLSLILVILSLISEYIVEVIYRGSEAYWLHLLDLFSVNLEESIPTWFSSILLFMAAGLLGLMAWAKWQAKDNFRWHWWGLSLAFLYLSMDEGAVIHEILSDPLNTTFNTTGYLFFGWQIVALPIVLIFALLYLRFLFHLPPRSRYGMILAGLMYVGGAIFVEGLSADELYRSNSLTYGYYYLSIATLEEALEMLGVVAFIYVLLDYIVSLDGQFIFSSSSLETLPEQSPKTKFELNEDVLEKWFKRLGGWQQMPLILLFLGGFNLALLAWLLFRELSSFLHNPEKTLLLLGFSFTAALWMSYRYSGFYRGKWLPFLAALSVLLTISLPISLRLLFLAFDSIQLAFLAAYSLPILMPLLIAAFYSLCLPYLLKQDKSVKPLYLSLFLGLGLGLLALNLLSHLGLLILLILAASILLLLLLFVNISRILWLGLAFITATVLWFFPALNAWSSSLWFQMVYDLPSDTTSRFSDYSPYQKIDVLQDGTGNLYLYVDGVAQFQPPRSQRQNILMGRVPASMILPENALVIGAASMQMELMIANYAGHVTTLEYDPMLLNISREHFVSYNFMDRLTNRSLELVEPVAYLNTSQTSYELIALDYSSVQNLRTGSFYTSDFFQAVSEHLATDGVFVLNLTEPFAPENTAARRIAASLLTVFDELIIVNSRSTGWSFAYAGQQLPFSAAELQMAIEVAGETEYGIFERSSIEAIVGNAAPIQISLDWFSLSD